MNREQALAALDRHNAEIAARLRASQEAIADAEALVRARQQERAGIMGEAIGAGWSHARIGAELNLSKQRVAQLLKADEG
jgi:hypothetical protein